MCYVLEYKKMGNANSSVKFGVKKTEPIKQTSLKGNEMLLMKKTTKLNTHVNDYIECKEVLALKTLIREKPNIFILNNLIMSIQLFTHYEKEIEEANKKTKVRENELNKKLLPEKTVLMPDILREHFINRIRFSSHCKSDNDVQTVEPLRPIRIYLMFENVLVKELDESMHYSSVNERTIEYIFILKEAAHKGYVRLEEKERLSSTKDLDSDIVDFSASSEYQNDIYNENESIYESIPSKKHINNTVRSSTSLPDFSNGNIYSEMKNNNHQIMNVPDDRFLTRSGIYSKKIWTTSSSSGYTTQYSQDSYSGFARPRSTIPEKCFKRVTYMYNGRIYNPRKEQRPMTSQQNRIRDAKLAHNYDIDYVSGCRFAKHFDEVLRARLASRMGFDDKVVKSARRIEATVHLEKLMPDYLSTKNYINIEQYEVIPCLSSPWPKWTRKWLERKRDDWPTYEDSCHLQNFPCHLVPESPQAPSTEKGLNNPLRKLDWCVSFPAADRYLESRVSDTQLTVYSIALMLHKTFVRAPNFGLRIEHVRHMLFWMVERQSVWPELEMGKYMMILLESLHNHIRQRTMPHYFMHDRNLFANSRANDLLHSQKQLKRMIENPVMFVFHAMEKIHYERNDYPQLDYKELLRILTINELLLANPLLVDIGSQSHGATASGYRRSEKKFWNEAKHANQHYMQTRKRKTNTFINPKQMLDTIIDIQEKCEPLTKIRLNYLVIFFSKHFLKMAKSCHEYGASQKKCLYLNQTRLLALLLAEDPDHQCTAEQIFREVHTLSDNVLTTTNVSKQMAPKPPKRNTNPPLMVSPPKD